VDPVTWSPVSTGEPRGKGGKQGRQAKGRRAIPAGVAAAVQAEALEGTRSQKEIARQYGVSRWYVKRLTETVTHTDPDEVAMLKRRLPQRLTILSAAATEKALEAIEDDEPGSATKWTFAAKLATEANRFAQPAADNPGEQLREFIAALNVQVNVNVQAAPQPDPIEAEVLALPEASA
jgi:hypothetical protein